MIQDNKWGKIFISIITFLFAVIMAVLTYMSFFEHCVAEIFSYLQERSIAQHRPLFYIAMAVVVTIMILVLCYTITNVLLRNKDTWKIVKTIVLICSGIVCIAGIFWIVFNDAVPKSDQKIVFHEARVIAGYVNEGYNYEYFERYPRNKGTLLIMALMLKIFGDSMISFRALNVVGAVILLLSISLATREIWKDEVTTIITAMLLAIYYPIVIYTCYMYGTLLSTAFSALGVYAIICFCRSKRLKHIIIALFAFPLGVQMHQSAAIVMIAAMFYLLIHMSKKTICKTLIYLFLLVGMVFASNKISDIIYYDFIAEIEPQEAVPALAYIYMGVSAIDGADGPG